MESLPAIISARSERQAMDWSLVLASQNIEASIERADGLWQLVVNGSDYARAVESIRQYALENRSEQWRQELPGTGLIFDWCGVLWFLLLVILFAMEQTRFGYLRQAGLMDNDAVRAGDWWRLLTATMLHANLAHLAANITSGLLLLGVAMGAFGRGPALLASVLAGVAGNVAGLLLYDAPHFGLGASGMVMGSLGLLTAQSLSLLREGLPGRQLMARGLLAGFLLLILLGLNPDPHTDVIAHVAGFLAGGVLGGALVFLPARLTQSGIVNKLAELFCGGLVALTWWLALR